MRRIAPCLAAACLLALAEPGYAQQTLWYSGDATGPSTYASGFAYSFSSPLYFIYQDFEIPAPGWKVTSFFVNNYFPSSELPHGGYWELRSGMTAQSPGVYVATDYSVFATPVATGRTASSGSGTLTEYTLQIDGLELVLPPGHYWLAVESSPALSLVAPFASQTSGSNCISTPCGNTGSAFVRAPFGSTFSAVPAAIDFSMGVIGTVASSPVPPIFCQVLSTGTDPVRAEGITEKIGDIILACTGGTPTQAGQPIPTTSILLSLNTKITSRVLGNGLSEATLTIDEPNAGSAAVPDQTVVIPQSYSPPQQLCASATACAETGTGGFPSPYDSQANVFAGQPTADGLSWTNIPIDPPGQNANRIIRLTNLRANASGLPLSTTLVPTAITAMVTPDPALISTIDANLTNVALLARGMVAAPTSANINKCSSHNASLIGGSGASAFDFLVTATEGFASAFERRDISVSANGTTSPAPAAQNVTGYPYSTESRFYAPVLFLDDPAVGLASYGTRILVKFNNVPAGVHLFVPVSIPLTNGGEASIPPSPPSPVAAGITTGQIRLVKADQFGNSVQPGYTSVASVAAIQGSAVAEMNYTGNTAYATYEVLNSDRNSTETASIPVAVAFNISGSSPTTGPVTINISEAPAGGPVAGILLANATAPVPRFVDSSAPETAFTIDACTVPVTVTTNPPVLTISVDGITSASPQNLNWTPGSMHTVAVASPQGDSNSRNVFASWSDGGAMSHQVSASSAATYTATFTQQYFLTTSAGAHGSVSPSSNWFNAGQVVPINGTSASGFLFGGWTGTGTGSFSGAPSSSSVTMNGPITESASFAVSAGPPAAISVTPNAGTSQSQIFAFSFTDPNGASDIVSAQMDINATLAVNGACYLFYVHGTKSLYLAGDAGAWQGPVTVGSAGTLQNSQCSVNAGTSSVAASGNTLTVSLSLTFKPAFAGAKNVYMEVRNISQDSGWLQKGTWTLGAPLPAATSVSPNSGRGMSQTFAFTFRDPNGAADITSVQMDIDDTLAVANACYLYYVRGTNAIYLASDAGVWQGPLMMGHAGILQNSQCSVNSGASLVTLSGNTLVLNLALTFQAAFNGAKNLYMEVQNASHDSGWAAFGAWTVGPTSDFSIGMTAGPGTVAAGISPAYVVTVTAINGFLGTVSFGVSGLPSGVTGSFNPPTVTGSGPTTLTLNTTGAPSSSFTITVTGTSSALQHNTTASLTITGGGGGPPQPTSVTPNTGTGLSQTFGFVFTAPNGVADITSAQMDINATLAVANACYLFYVRGPNALYLASDAGVWQGPVTVGNSGTLHNSQCSVDAGTSAVTGSETTLRLSLALTFKASFVGPKNVYMEVQNASHDSGWSFEGNWTVGSGGGFLFPPEAVSVVPDRGTGSSHNFAFAFADGVGATDISSAQIDINASLAENSACYLYYVRNSNTLYLASDTGVWQGPLTIGTASTLQNSQCSVNAGASSVSAVGTTLTVNLALTFKAAFIGPKTIFMEVRNASYDSGWVIMGGWSVN